MDTVGDRFEQAFQELPCGAPVCLLDQLGDCELAGAVDCHEEIKLAFCRLHLGDVHVKEADGIALEALTLGFVPFDIRQARDAMSLKAAMQR